MTFGSLFAGIGGFDLGFERAGMTCAWQVDNNPACCRLLFNHWPAVPKYGDIREFVELDVSPVDVICGGDPCPKHSRARSNGASVHPDLSGYFLAVVGRCKPRWVVRENILAPTVDWFDATLNALGYATAIVRLDAAEVTGQSRPRDFIVGLYGSSRAGIRRVFPDSEDGPGIGSSRLGTREVAACLTAHRTRYDSRGNYVWAHGNRLRILECVEREALAGFPEGWTVGFHAATRAKMCGNAVVPACAEWIGRRIVDAMV